MSSSPFSAIRETPLCRWSAARVSTSGCVLESSLSEGGNDEHPHDLLGRDQMLQKQQTSFVGPLQILEDKHDRLVF